jgi:hypothetical protein
MSPQSQSFFDGMKKLKKSAPALPVRVAAKMIQQVCVSSDGEVV